jgi:hypothetical protein
MNVRYLALVCSLAFLLLTGVASAQQQVAPPGTSGVDEYLETIPSAEGNRRALPPSSGGDDEPTGGGGGALKRSERRELEQLGADGRRAAALAEATTPADAVAAPGGSRPDPAVRGIGRDGDGDGVASALTNSIGGDGGMGVLLPILLVVSALVAAGIGLARVRMRGASV